ncbi:RING/FYVE/PHD zinc finger protein [Sesbania bispinosa]|nr:RING/FYVE/PHD zinc finger protein [Sesbania bispinosa]
MSEPSMHSPSSKPTRSVARAHQKAPPPPPLHVPGQGTEIQFPCNSCNTILNVAHGLDRFTCPHCGVNIALDGSTSIASRSGSSSPPPQANKIA